MTGYVVVWREERRQGRHVLQTTRVFEDRASAEEYRAGLDASRDPQVVDSDPAVTMLDEDATPGARACAWRLTAYRMEDAANDAGGYEKYKLRQMADLCRERADYYRGLVR